MHAYTFGDSGSSLTILCHMIGVKVGIITYVQIFGGGLHPRNFGGHKIENLARFRTMFEFEREYLRKRSRY